MRRIKRKRGERILAWILCMAILLQGTPVYAADVQDQIPYTMETQESETIQPEIEIEEEEPTLQPEETETGADSDVPQVEENTEDTEHTTPTEPTDFSSVYENGVIKIYNALQLESIGSGQAVHLQDDQQDSFGTGEEVTENGTVIRYNLDANYQLMNEIELSAKKLWSLPDGFTGTFSGAPSETDPLYDNTTDTIYVYNNYQLQLIASDTSEKEPVMSQDMLPENIGIGRFLYKDGTPTDDSLEAAQEYLTYSKAHRYVLAMNFTEKIPEKLADQYAAGKPSDEQLGGRMHVGQQYIERDGMKYILIGNEQQLRAIGSGKQVTPMLFARAKGVLGLGAQIIPYYPGDADFNIRSLENQNIKMEDIYKRNYLFRYFEKDTHTDLMNADLQHPNGLLEGIGSILEGLLGGLVEDLLGGIEIVGLQGENTQSPSIGAHIQIGKDEFVDIDEIKSKYDDLQYTANANYIIFRNIDLKEGEFSNGKNDPWNPINISGKFEGRLGLQERKKATISNIHVHQTGELDPSTTRGIGFFGSISSQRDENDIGISKGTTIVEGIHLENVTVQNESTKVKEVDHSLVEILLGTVGGVLGGVLNLVEGLLDALIPGLEELKLGDLIVALLTIQANRPDIFATGSFAGRVIGDVQIQNCTVANASVSNVKDMTGGFVGYTEGTEKYDGLSKLLGGAVKLLSTLLNIIPGIGLGDLITVLLDNNILDVGKLIPVGYYKPKIENCSITLDSNTAGIIGSDTTKYNGGFVGMQIGTEITNCTVDNIQKVQALKGAGGFAGIERDAAIESTLSDLGVDLKLTDISSKQDDCKVNSTMLKVSAVESYAGGFNGIMANSKSSGCIVNNISEVKAKSYAGGFAGRATIGYAITIGKEDGVQNKLLESVTNLLASVVTGEEPAISSTLLALSGLTPSEIYHCSVQGIDTGMSVTATEKYAGGLIGQGDGTNISRTKKATATQPEEIDPKATTISALSTVTAKNYAGGIAGSIVTANPIGVLNTTIGVGSYLPFYAGNIQLTGKDLTVTAEEKYASAGVGLMLGGKVNKVNVQGVRTVTAQNFVGGLAGRVGSGNLAKTDGLDILGLGLIKVNNVLSLAEGVNVKIKDTQIQGVEAGATLHATGTPNEPTSKEEVFAGGLLGEADGVQVTDTTASKIKEVKADKNSGEASFAGGFVGKSHTGGLAGIADEGDNKLALSGILDVSNLLTLVPYLLPEYNRCKVTFVSNGENPQVEADYAGGFFGEMNSGKVIHEATEGDGSQKIDPYAVEGIEYVKATDYAGGFAGNIKAGSVAASNGLELLDGILSLDIGDLLSVLSVYIPHIEYAGVKSSVPVDDKMKDVGLRVEATGAGSCAGGYAGTASGATIKNSNVESLRHTKVVESDYFKQSSYAVKAQQYAGGFVGRADIDSAAQVGGGLKLLNLLDLSELLSAINVVSTTIENCNVSGMIGGYSVLANGKDKTNKVVGKAGGFVGEGSGCRISNGNAYNFNYIIGQEMAGGYAGKLEPGNVAAVLGEKTDILNEIVNLKDSLASLVNVFVPVIKNSETTSVPCGGTVRAEGTTDTDCTRGFAGGYVGYNQGGTIKGLEKGANGSKECAVIRLRTVYGTEAAGGFTGFMETADLADAGNLNLLFGIVNVGNVLSLLNAVYPTETNTAVYGPLRKMDVDTWNKWADAVAANGVYGEQFPTDKVTDQTLGDMIKKYAYGYDVTAGRTKVGTLEKQLGDAGGYVGKMQGGVITEAHAWDAKSVTAYKSAGGFVGEMITGGVAKVGDVSLVGDKLNVLGSINAVETFIPVIRNSDVTGFQSGLNVRSTGVPNQGQKVEKVGYAGGYVGHSMGGQIWGSWKTETNPDEPSLAHITDAVEDPKNQNRCFVDNLRQVNGTASVGGFAGLVEPGSAAALDTASKGGLLGGMLQHLITAPGDLAQVLNATVAVIEAADVKAWDDYGVVINGVYSDGSPTTKYAKAVGGFAGELQGTVIGKLNDTAKGATVKQLRSVVGGKHAGGFFGYADVSSVAEISGSDGSGGQTTILGILAGLNSTSVLDSFRTYVYDSKVIGINDTGFCVEAKEGGSYGYVNTPLFLGNAGGFGGSMCNGSVKNSSVENLRDVKGKNYVGGFIGHMDKGGVLQAENVNVLEKFLGVGADVLSTFGTHADDCSVVGIKEGYTVRSENEEDEAKKDEIVGGFVGYADLARMKGNKVENLKQVSSGQTAGGFVGETTFRYLAEIKVDSPLVNKLLDFLRIIIREVWNAVTFVGDIIHVNLGILEVDVISKEDGLLHVNLLGLDIGIELVKNQGFAWIHIGDSKIKINCDTDGNITNTDEELLDEIHVSLIKANRTRIERTTITGIPEGYDVYGGGAGNDRNGAGKKGRAGGFVGFNNEGLFKNNEMYLADVVRGAEKITGPFSGQTELNTNTPDFINSVFKIEGEGNHYRIYRDLGEDAVENQYTDVTSGSKELQNEFHHQGTKNVYVFYHRFKDKVEKFLDLKGAMLSSDKAEEKIPLNAYMENGAKAVLMGDVPTHVTTPEETTPPPDAQDPCKDTVQLRIRKVWKGDKEANRPDKIVVHITRKYTDDTGQEVQDQTFNGENHTVELTKKDFYSENVWEKVLSGQPYTAYHVDEATGKKYYYTYEFTEESLPGYKTTITYDDQNDKYPYNVTITNKKTGGSILPDTGGAGTFWIYTVGILVLFLLATTELKRRRENKITIQKNKR